MKPPIPIDRQEDVLHMYWQLLLALENRAEDTSHRQLVEAAYRQLNQLGYTVLRPTWKSK